MLEAIAVMVAFFPKSKWRALARTVRVLLMEKLT